MNTEFVSAIDNLPSCLWTWLKRSEMMSYQIQSAAWIGLPFYPKWEDLLLGNIIRKSHGTEKKYINHNLLCSINWIISKIYWPNHETNLNFKNERIRSWIKSYTLKINESKTESNLETNFDLKKRPNQIKNRIWTCKTVEPNHQLNL